MNRLSSVSTVWVVISALSLGLQACDDSRGGADVAPALAATDAPPAAALASQHLPDNPAGHKVVRYFEATNNTGPTAERSARDLLAGLRADPEAAILTVRSAYSQTPEASYRQRWRLVSLAAELATPNARPLLAEIAASALPPERMARIPGAHWEGGSQQEEIMIRTEALGGLGRLARAGDRQAEEAIAQVVRSPDRVIRATAVHELLKAGGYAPDRIRAIGARLSADDQWMLSQREMTLAEMPDVVPPGPSKKNKVLPAFRPSAP